MSETTTRPGTAWLSEALARLEAIPREIERKTAARDKHRTDAMLLTADLYDLRAEQKTLEAAMARLRRRGEKPAKPAPAASDTPAPGGDGQ